MLTYLLTHCIVHTNKQIKMAAPIPVKPVLVFKKKGNNNQVFEEILVKAKKTFATPIIVETRREYVAWEKNAYIVSRDSDMMRAHEFIVRGWDFCLITRDYVANNSIDMLPHLSDLESLLKRKPFLTRVLNPLGYTPATVACNVFNYLTQLPHLGDGNADHYAEWNVQYMQYLIQLVQLLNAASQRLLVLEHE